MKSQYLPFFTLLLLSIQLLTSAQQVVVSIDEHQYNNIGGEWMDLKTYDYSYNEDCLITELMVTGVPHFFDGTIDGSRRTYSYNEQGLLTEGYLASMLNGVITDTSSWFVYSWDNGQLSTLTSYHTPFGIDDIRNRETYSYNYAGDLIETIYSNWDDDIQDFVNDEKDALIYINSDLSSSFHSSWDTGSNTWVVESKTENAYTQGGLLIEAVSSDWDEESLTYLLKKRYTYEYQLGTLTNSLTEYYHTNWQNWNPLFNYEYSFQNCTPVLHVGEQNVGLGVEMYPNPASSRINLKFGNSKTAQSYRIFNLKGQIVQTDRLFKEPEEIDISNLSAGMYILELLIDNNRTRKTLVVE